MKKGIGIVALLLNSFMISAQSELDISKFVIPDIVGTARYMSMGGAMGAVGGDASAIKDNPAGLGIYRSSEMTGTLNILRQNTDANWYGVNSANNLYKLGTNNFSLVISSATQRSKSGKTSGLQNSNFSFSFQKLKDFNRQLNIHGGSSSSSMTDYMAYFTQGIPETDLQSTDSYEPFDNTYIPWLSVLAYEGYLINPSANNKWVSFLSDGERVTPSYYLTESGSINEYSFSWAGNFSNQFYLGVTANIQSIYYNATTNYNEAFGQGGSMNLNNTIKSSGNGFNLNIGAILRPIDAFRMGISFQTPTVFSISEDYTSLLNFDTEQRGYVRTPNGYNSYKFQAPLQFTASVAYLFGKNGLISAEYDYIDVKTSKLMDNNNSFYNFMEENEGMNMAYNSASTIKLGAEYRLTDNFSLRGGYAFMDKVNPDNAQKFMKDNTIRTDTEYFLHNSTQYITGGFGYREESWFLDFAYMNKLNKEKFHPYNSNNLAEFVQGSPANVSTTNNNFVITLGFKF